MNQRYYIRFVESLVGTEQQVSMRVSRVLPRYAWMVGNPAEDRAAGIPIYALYAADYIWYYDDSKVKYIKNREGRDLAEEELTLAHLSAVDLRA